MDRISFRRRLLLGLGAGSMLAGTLAGPAFASDSVVLSITGSGLTASVADLTLTSAAYQNAAHDLTGTMVLTVDDNRPRAEPEPPLIQNVVPTSAPAAGRHATR